MIEQELFSLLSAIQSALHVCLRFPDLAPKHIYFICRWVLDPISRVSEIKEGDRTRQDKGRGAGHREGMLEHTASTGHVNTVLHQIPVK